MTEANDWSDSATELFAREASGIWGSVEGLHSGAAYNYHIVSRHRGYRVDKADPFAFQSEIPPKTASVVLDSSYAWRDHEWMATRGARNSLKGRLSIYELHIGSWARVAEQGGRWLELPNSDSPTYSGSGWGNFGGVESAPVGVHGRPISLNMNLPPLGALFLKPDATVLRE